MTNSTIPQLHLADFCQGAAADRDRFVHELGKGLTAIGFVAVQVDPVPGQAIGLDRDLLAAAYQVAAEFFGLPEAVKCRYETPQGQRGFTRFGREHARNQATPDLKEFWHMGRERTPDLEAVLDYAANIWPLEVPRFQPVLTALYQQLDAIAQQLLIACACYLDLPPTIFASMTTAGNTILRLIHYPPIPANAPPASLRAAPHEDINLITLLPTATDAGLEVLRRDGTWLPIPALPGYLIVDAGDMLQWVTNGLFKSTTHRVVNPDDGRSRRFSLPFFVHPHPSIDLTPLPACIARTGGQPLFPPITAGAYLAQRLQEIGLGT